MNSELVSTRRLMSPLNAAIPTSALLHDPSAVRSNGVEHIDFHALGGTDNIVVGDLTGTDVTKVAIDLGASTGGGDTQPDTITVNATDGDDVIVVTRDGNTVTVSGLTTEVTIANFDATDRLVINGLGGDDVI